jgi:hypothetical protein
VKKAATRTRTRTRPLPAVPRTRTLPAGPFLPQRLTRANLCSLLVSMRLGLDPPFTMPQSTRVLKLGVGTQGIPGPRVRR